MFPNQHPSRIPATRGQVALAIVIVVALILAVASKLFL